MKYGPRNDESIDSMKMLMSIDSPYVRRSMATVLINRASNKK